MDHSLLVSRAVLNEAGEARRTGFSEVCNN